jgi:hypothetical protein
LGCLRRRTRDGCGHETTRVCLLVSFNVRKQRLIAVQNYLIELDLFYHHVIQERSESCPFICATKSTEITLKLRTPSELLYPCNPTSTRGVYTKLSSSGSKIVYTNGRTVIVRISHLKLLRFFTTHIDRRYLVHSLRFAISM